jgi:ABC-type branched-subunit amino acid transport system substrate-binding protein
MKAKGKACLLLLALILVALPVLSACAREKEEVITIHQLPCLTGPWAAVASPGFRGAEVYMRYVNEELGGIAGRKVEYKWADTGYQAERTLSIYDRYKAENPLVVIIYGSPDGEALKPKLEADKIPGFNFGQSDAQIFPPAYNFIWGVPYVDAFVRYMEWLVQQRAPERPKLALVMLEYGWSLIHKTAAEQLADRIGIDFVDSEVISVAPTDLTTMLTRFHENGVTDIYMSITSAGFAVAAANLVELGYADEMTMTNFWWGPIDELAESIGDKAIGMRNLTPWRSRYEAATDAGVKTVVDYYNKLYAEPPKMAVITGWMGMELVFEAIRRAIEEVGYENLTGEAVKEGFESITDFEGIIHPKVTLGPGQRVTNNKLRIMEVQKDPDTGELKPMPITDWFEVTVLPRDAEGNILWDQYTPPQ